MVAFCNSPAYRTRRLRHNLQHPTQFKQPWRCSVQLAQARLPAPKPLACAEQPQHEQGLCRCTSKAEDCHLLIRLCDNAPPCMESVVRLQCGASPVEKDPFPSCCTAPGAWQQHLVSIWLFGPESKSACGIPASSVNPHTQPHHKEWAISVAQCIISWAHLSYST